MVVTFFIKLRYISMDSLADGNLVFGLFDLSLFEVCKRQHAIINMSEKPISITISLKNYSLSHPLAPGRGLGPGLRQAVAHCGPLRPNDLILRAAPVPYNLLSLERNPKGARSCSSWGGIHLDALVPI